MRLSEYYFELFGLTIECYEMFIFSNLVSNNFKPLQIVKWINWYPEIECYVL